LLLQEIGASRLGGLQLQRQMHALMPAILLRVARLDALDVDTEPEPPDGEPRQIEQSVGASERHSVVGSDRLGQAELLEDAIENGEGVDFLGRVQRFAGQTIAAGEVGDRQRVAIALIGKHELAFVIGAPQVVGQPRIEECCSFSPVAPPPTVLDQAVAVEDGMHG
jgi:hypothetical protein